jgi:large subunit ribosomal protein L23
MGLFDRVHKKTLPKAVASDEKKKPTEQTTTEFAEQATDVVAVPAAAGGNSPRLLLKPHVSEKAASSAKGVYVFDVPRSANKVEIRKAVEALYNVKVESVRTIRGIGKKLKRGKIQGRRADWKKALVSLKKGQTIDVYEGV